MSPPIDVSHVDRLGARVSLVCAIHCALMPFTATILPLLGFGFLADPRLEKTILVASISLATVSICWGIRLHRQRRILILFGAALSLIILGRSFSEGALEAVFVVPGGVLFVCGHLLNQRLSRQCSKCRHEY